MDQTREQQAFVLRMKPGGLDAIEEGLEHDRLIIGWSDAEGLLDLTEWTAMQRFTALVKYDEEKLGGALID